MMAADALVRERDDIGREDVGRYDIGVIRGVGWWKVEHCCPLLRVGRMFESLAQIPP